MAKHIYLRDECRTGTHDEVGNQPSAGHRKGPNAAVARLEPGQERDNPEDCRCSNGEPENSVATFYTHSVKDESLEGINR